MAARTDKPIVQDTLNGLRREVENPEPYRIALSNSKVITFPDIFAMEAEEAEEFLADMNPNSRVSTVLAKWLNEADYAALKNERLTLRETKVLFERVMAYYETILGSEGEELASAGS